MVLINCYTNYFSIYEGRNYKNIYMFIEKKSSISINLNSNLKWSLVGSASGNGADNSVALPAEYSELLLTCESANAGCYTFNILKEVLDDSLKSFRNGYYSSNNMYGTITLNVSTSQAYIGSYSANGVAATSMKLTVHYK